jgi:hypothetical protein
MSRLRLPARIEHPRRTREMRSFPAHRAWVRRHRCSVPGCLSIPIECAHVRRGTDGGQGLKPSDRWTISLCRTHHAEQHRIGEVAFERRHGIELVPLAKEFARRSPYRRLWEEGAGR